MSKFRKFIFTLALALLPASVFAGTDGGFVEVEIHTFPSQGGIVKSLPHLPVECIYCTQTQELLLSMAAEGCGRGLIAKVSITEFPGNGEVFSTQERVPMFCLIRLPDSGVYQILITTSSGQCFMGMLMVGDYLRSFPFRTMFYEDAGLL